jgi:hypothetical protein
MTKLRRAVREDDELREQARDVIRRSMAGDPSVTKPMLDSARALFSYRSSEPPRRGEREPNRHPGRGCYSIIDLLKTADELGILRQLGFVLDRGGLAEYERRVVAAQDEPAPDPAGHELAPLVAPRNGEAA